MMIVHPLIRSFVNELEKLGKSRNTLSCYRIDLQHFLHHLEYEIPDTAAGMRDAINRHATRLQEEGKGISTVNRFLAAARGFSRHLRDRNLITDEIRMEYGRPEPAPRQVPEAIGLYEVHTIIEEAIAAARTPEARWLHARNHFILQLIEEYGLKPYEIVKLKKTQFREGFLYLGDGRELRMSPRISLFLDFYLKETLGLYGREPEYLFFGTGRSGHSPLSTKTVERVLRRYGDTRLTTDGIRGKKILRMEVNEENARNFGYKSHYTLKYRKEQLQKQKNRGSGTLRHPRS